MKGPERARIVRGFRSAVNMTRHELSEWLDTDESNEVGWRRSPGEESVGHQSGRWIVLILGKRSADLTDVDLLHMRTVIGYVRRHLAQRPVKNVSTSRWGYSLRNWGHDPAKPPTLPR
jgi:hypothetical protein